MRLSEITERMLRKGWTTESKYGPLFTVGVSIADDVRDRGASSRFVRVDRGVYALNPNRTSGATVRRPALTHPAGDSAHPKKMTFTDAAEQILGQSGEREPMHYRALTERALELGLVITQGQTPAATMYAQILTEIRRRQERGESPRFVKHGRGMVGLTTWLPVGVALRIEEENRKVRGVLLERVRQASPAAFEDLVGELLVAIGFENVQVTSKSHDGGIDVRGTLVVGDAVRIRMAVQAKRWENNVSSPVVQQVRGSLGAHEQGLIIATSGFTKGATKEAQRADATPVALVGGAQLATLLAEHEIGVRRTSYDLLTLDD